MEASRCFPPLKFPCDNPCLVLHSCRHGCARSSHVIIPALCCTLVDMAVPEVAQVQGHGGSVCVSGTHPWRPAGEEAALRLLPVRSL